MPTLVCGGAGFTEGTGALCSVLSVCAIGAEVDPTGLGCVEAVELCSTLCFDFAESAQGCRSTYRRAVNRFGVCLFRARNFVQGSDSGRLVRDRDRDRRR